MKTASLCRFALVLLLAVSTAHSAHAEGAAATRIDALHESLLGVMKNATSLGYEGRSSQLAPVIPQYFDVPFMAAMALGRSSWRKATDEEKRRYVESFQGFMVASYAGRFDGYSGQKFETVGQEPVGDERVLIRTHLVDPGNEKIELNYVMRQVDADWKIIDVHLDGTVSQLAQYYSEFSSIVRREGFDALIETLDEKVEKLKDGDEA